MSSRKRPTDEYLDVVDAYAAIVPAFKKYKRRKTLKAGEKAFIARIEKQFAHGAESIFAISPSAAKKLKHATIAPGAHAIRLSGTPRNSKIQVNKDGSIDVAEPKRHYKYIQLPPGTTGRNIQERLADLARDVFQNYNPLAVNLWTNNGVAGQEYGNVRGFINKYVNDHVGRYKTKGDYVTGVAVLLSEDEDFEEPEDDYNEDDYNEDDYDEPEDDEDGY